MPFDRLRRRLRRQPPAGELDDATRRWLVAELIVDYGRLCGEVGPWAYAADIGAPPDATIRQIAYLAVWHDCPRLRAWAFVAELGAENLLIEAATRAFADHAARNAP